MNNLPEIMKEMGWTREKASEALGVAVTTIDGYLAPEHASSYRKIPDKVLWLAQCRLEIKRMKK